MVQTDKKLNCTSLNRNQENNKSSWAGLNTKSNGNNNETKTLTKDQMNTINTAKSNPFGSKFKNEAYFKSLHNF